MRLRALSFPVLIGFAALGGSAIFVTDRVIGGCINRAFASLIAAMSEGFRTLFGERIFGNGAGFGLIETSAFV